MRAPGLRAGPLLLLAWRDVLHDRWLALGAACVLGATLAPLWTLWGLQAGIIGTLIDRQNRDPAMREIRPESGAGHRFDEAWFREVALQPGVAFVIPNTRSIAAQVDLHTAAAGNALRVDLLPTAAGDPLLGARAAPRHTGLVLSHSAAQRLKASAGNKVTLLLERQRGEKQEAAAALLAVEGVLAEDEYDRAVALAPLALLEDVQFWRDGYTVTVFGADGNGAAPRQAAYPLFRLYAHSIREVDALAASLEARGVAVYTRGREIAATLGLQKNVRAILAIVAAIALAGSVIALWALQLSTVRRKRRDFAILILTGHGRGWLIGTACLSATAVALAGAAIGLAAATLAGGAINTYFSAHFGATESAVRMAALDVVVGTAAALLLCLIPAAWGGWLASNMKAGDELREI